MNYLYGLDYSYIVFILPALILSLFAQIKVSSTFSKYSKMPNARRLTGADVASKILSMNGIYDVKVERVSGNLTDHYDPKGKILRLSDSVFSSTSVAALGVAAHECGHAIQHAKAYAPLKFRTSVYPVVNISSRLALPLFLVGLILNSANLQLFGIVLFSAVVLFQLVTLPVEINASNRAIKILRSGMILYDDEVGYAKKVLIAAALTYVASAFMAIMQLLRLLIISNNRRR